MGSFGTILRWDGSRWATVEIANDDPKRPRDIIHQIPLDLETIVLKAMDKDPRRRYQDASELEDDLRRFIDDQPAHFQRQIRYFLHMIQEFITGYG